MLLDRAPSLKFPTAPVSQALVNLAKRKDVVISPKLLLFQGTELLTVSLDALSFTFY